MARKFQLVYVQHEGAKWPAQIVQVNCPQDKRGEPSRLGGPDELVDVSLFEAIVPEDNGDPNYEKIKAKNTEYKIFKGLSNVRKANGPGDRSESTWWDRMEDDAKKEG